MRKVSYILVIIILTAGCSVSKRQKRNLKSAPEQVSRESLYDRIVSQNLTSQSFFIEKAVFKISSEDGNKTGTGTIKFKMPDKFLISIKSVGGIELARIFLSGDSIMINDRMDRKLILWFGELSY